MHWRYFGLVLAGLVAGVYCATKALDPDIWWHIRVGEWVVEQRNVPSTDPFSQAGRENAIPWMAYSWLFEVTAHGFQRAFSTLDAPFLGILIFKVVLNAVTTSVLALFLFRRQGITLLSTIVLVLALLPFSFLYAERPWHATIWFTIFTLAAAENLLNGRTDRWLWLLPVAYAAWANTHIQFVLGLGILGLAAIEAALRRDRAVLLRMIALGSACTFATLLNPYHLRLWLVVYEYATQTTALRNVSELAPPEFREPREWFFMALAVAALGRLAFNRFPRWETMLFAAALFFSLRMRRDLWFGTAVSAYLILPRNPDVPRVRARLVIALLLCGMLVSMQATNLLQERDLDNQIRETYPVDAAEFIEREKLAGPLWNTFDWGGYLILRLPDHPVSIDGRTNLYGEARLQQYFKTWRGQDGWNNDPALLNAKLILVPASKPENPIGITDRLLEHPERWEMIFEGGNARLFKPKGN